MQHQKEAICIGRFQLPHYGHIHLIEEALSLADHVTVVLGSANEYRTNKNPFTWIERKEMLSLCFSGSELKRISFAPINDHPDDRVWIQSIMDLVPKNNAKPVLVGHHKDGSTYYLSLFEDWELREARNIDDLHSTELRDLYFDNAALLDDSQAPWAVINYLRQFAKTAAYKKLTQGDDNE